MADWQTDFNEGFGQQFLAGPAKLIANILST